MEPVSVSQVQAYLACPLKYRFQYMDRIPPPWRAAALAFGSSIHAAVEWFHRERLAGRTPRVEEVIAIFEADWYAANLGPVVFGDKESKEDLGKKGEDLIRLYVAEANSLQPTRIEERFEIDLVDPTTREADRFDIVPSHPRGSRQRREPRFLPQPWPEVAGRRTPRRSDSLSTRRSVLCTSPIHPRPHSIVSAMVGAPTRPGRGTS